MNNQEIATSVEEIKKILLSERSGPPSEEDQMRVLGLATALLVNFLQNINDIAERARSPIR